MTLTHRTISPSQQLRHDVEREDREIGFQQNQYYEELKQLAGNVEEAKRNEMQVGKQLETAKVRGGGRFCFSCC